MCKDGGFGEGVLKSVKGFLTCGGPLEGGVLSSELDQGPYYCRIFVDEPSVEIGKTQESSEFSKV